jgi:hypothetical protein
MKHILANILGVDLGRRNMENLCMHINYLLNVFGRPRRRSEDNIKMEFLEVG